MAREGDSGFRMNFVIIFVIISFGLLTDNVVKSQGQCQPITVPLCKGIHWNITMFPNHMRQRTQEEAGLTVHEFYPLIQAKCSPYLKQLICAIYTPPCTWDGGLIPACKSFCTSVRDGCAPILEKFGFQWPFNCDKPSSYIAGETEICMDAMMPSTTVFPDNTIKPTQAGVVQSTLSSAVTTENPTTGRCEPVNIPLCEDVNYKTTLLPNNLGHTTQDDAGLEVHQFYPLVKVQCSAFLKNFLCALYSPPCIMLKGKPLPVCKSLCVAAKNGCVTLMRKFGFEWPASLDCESNSYIVPDNQTCFGYDLQTTMASTKPSTMTPTRSRCEKLESSVCKNLPWNVTHVPNFLNHETQRKAEMDIREFSPIIEMQCSAFTKLFLCGIYSPKCEGGEPVPVCRSLCEKVKETCEPWYEQFGFAWPSELKCGRDKKHIADDSERCVGMNLIPTPQPNTMHWRFTERSQIISTTVPPTTAPPSDSLKARKRSRCEIIRVPMCKRLPWRHTQMPNFVGDINQKKARSNIRNYIPLVKYGCSKYLKHLVCAVYEPKCDPKTREKVPVCASMCHLVKSQCMEVINAFNLNWSSDLDCDNSPYIVPDNQTCVGVPGGIKTTSPPTTSPDLIATTYHYKRKPTPDEATEQPSTAPVGTTDQAGPDSLPEGTTTKPEADLDSSSTREPVTEIIAGKPETDSVVHTSPELVLNGASTVSVTTIEEELTKMQTEYITPGFDIDRDSNHVTDAETTESDLEIETMPVEIISELPIMETHQPTPESSKVSTLQTTVESKTTKMQKPKTDAIIEPSDKNNLHSTEQSVMIKSTKSEKDIMFTTEESHFIDVLKTSEQEIVSTKSHQETSSEHMAVTKDNEEHVKMYSPTEKAIVVGTTLESATPTDYNNRFESSSQPSRVKVYKIFTESKMVTETPLKNNPTSKNMTPKENPTTSSQQSTFIDDNGVKPGKHKPPVTTDSPNPHKNKAGKEGSKPDFNKYPDHIEPRTVKNNQNGPIIKTTNKPKRHKEHLGVPKDQGQTDSVAKSKPDTREEPAKDGTSGTTHRPRPVVILENVSQQSGDSPGVSDRPNNAPKHPSSFFMLPCLLFIYFVLAGR